MIPMQVHQKAPATVNKLRELLNKLQSGKTLDVRLEERNDTPLTWAVSEGYHDIAVTLIEAGVDVNAQNVDGNTALLRAACEGRAELASVLLRVGAKPDLQNADGYSALVLAKRRGNREIVDMLLACGADRSLRTSAGEGPVLGSWVRPGALCRLCAAGLRWASSRLQLR